MMLPDFIPFKNETVYFTGAIEIAAVIETFKERRVKECVKENQL